MPFDHKIIGNEAVITGLGNKSSSSVTIPAMIRQFGFEHPTKDNYLPPLNVQIGSSAFANKTSLTNVTLTNNWIGGVVNYPDETPEEIEIGLTRNIINIGNSAFKGCTSLKAINIPSSVTRIETYAFSGCSGLTSLTIQSGVQFIGTATFSGTGLTLLTTTQTQLATPTTTPTTTHKNNTKDLA